MALENFPSAETPKTIPPPPKSNLRPAIIAVLIILLLATWGYIIWDKNKNAELVATKDKQIAKSTAESDTLQSLLAEATNRYDSIKTSSAKKDSALTSKDKEIAEKQSKIQSILSKQNATKAELSQAKLMIASLNQDIDGYKAQIEALKTANTQLTVEKQAVTQERDMVKKGLDSTEQVVKQRESVIDIGSTLHASNFNILGIDQKSNGKEKETTNAKKVNKLRISFDLDENMITQSGNKTLYICITGPDGKQITDEDSSSSATFTTRDSVQLPYTQKMDVSYTQNKRQTVSFDWKQKSNFSIGDYKIEVYNNGFKIGSGVAHLKKGGLFG